MRKWTGKQKVKCLMCAVPLSLPVSFSVAIHHTGNIEQYKLLILFQSVLIFLVCGFRNHLTNSVASLWQSTEAWEKQSKHSKDADKPPLPKKFFQSAIKTEQLPHIYNFPQRHDEKGIPDLDAGTTFLSGVQPDWHVDGEWPWAFSGKAWAKQLELCLGYELSPCREIYASWCCLLCLLLLQLQGHLIFNRLLQGRHPMRLQGPISVSAMQQSHADTLYRHTIQTMK